MSRLTRLAAVAAAIGLVAFGVSTQAAASTTTLAPTVTSVVRPVHANGTPVHGYRVTTEKIDQFTCDSASDVAVSNGVAFCGFSATYTVACWKSVDHTVLCLRSVWKKTLVRIRYTGSFPHVTKVKHPTPMDMRLYGGNHCSIRDGGAWDSVNGHKSWYGTYSCTHGSLYGPTKNNGIVVSTKPWTVHVVTGFSRGTGKDKQHVHDARVQHAYYVGTAA